MITKPDTLEARMMKLWSSSPQSTLCEFALLFHRSEARSLVREIEKMADREDAHGQVAARDALRELAEKIEGSCK